MEEAQRALTDLGKEVRRILDREGEPGLPAGFFTALFWSVEEGYRGRGGRLLLMALLIAAAYLFYRVMPRAQESPSEPCRSWMDLLRKIGFPLAVGILLFLAALVAMGYYYTAVRFLNYAHSSFWPLMGARWSMNCALRWLPVSMSRKGGEERP